MHFDPKSLLTNQMTVYNFNSDQTEYLQGAFKMI